MKTSFTKTDLIILIAIPVIGLALGWFLYGFAPRGNSPKQAAQESLDIKDEYLYEDDAPTIGNKNAKAKVVIFSDYQCPYCKNAQEKMSQILKDYDGKTVLIHRNFVVHPTAEIHARAAEAANLQGKFREMDEALFEDAPKDETAVVEIARKIGLDEKKFKEDLNSEKVKDRIKKDGEEADKIGLTGTPSIFVNGEQSNISKLEEDIKSLID